MYTLRSSRTKAENEGNPGIEGGLDQFNFLGGNSAIGRKSFMHHAKKKVERKI
jgi:hypothetical protein